MSLSNIRIVLIQTSHPGNIGAAARAMKTMGLSELCLVNPLKYPDPQAEAMAAGAEDVLQAASIVSSLSEAIADCQHIIGTSARSQRTLRWSLLEPRECGQYAAKHSPNDKVAIVFGRERTGLTNEELALCHQLVHIPSNPDYSSLNVAAAVQILSYECRVAELDRQKADGKETPQVHLGDESLDEEIVSAEAMDGFYQQLENLMIETGFLDPENPRYLMRRMRRLYGRIQVTKSELNILRGSLSAFEGRKFRRRDKD
ncbi:tRNA (cytosine(32)/uridine(32)-2'-O)-methyltransferase TrmJ [Leucothrix pacifica]|uniref:tRNA (cytidine/uridine-2'-O-)-methyltransferase TrmJ n=1 Tax=Leucothrix pacifica TaxID=1247513 RepID=A0A317CF43_9GAMM|nr:tRNA (cytosine(32)/uridine(32)-2'-O)-methyltransferase TrmJ [Leucothrix pacifica]PWQ97136.1 tRNA (cytosine(32)/uridine(32)-2'-O)-methyltransferase TrmJ [Leucothrix pacifica]